MALSTRVSDKSKNELNSKLQKRMCKTSGGADRNPPLDRVQVYFRVPKCVGYAKEATVHDQVAKSKREVNDFKAIIEWLVDQKYNYTIYLAPLDQHALHQWMKDNKEILGSLNKDQYCIVSEWRKEKEWKKASENYLGFKKLVDDLSKLDINEVSEDHPLILQAKDKFKPRSWDDSILDKAKCMVELIEKINNMQLNLLSDKEKDELLQRGKKEFGLINPVETYQFAQKQAGLIKKLAQIDRGEMKGKNEILKAAKSLPFFSQPTPAQAIVIEARVISDIINKMLQLDISQTKKRANFKTESDEFISKHIVAEVIDYISWKHPLNPDDSEPTSEPINVLVYAHDLFKSMQITDSFANKMGYAKSTPIHLNPKMEEVRIKEILPQGNESYVNKGAIAENVTGDLKNRMKKELEFKFELIKNFTKELALEDPQKGAEFIYRFIEMHELPPVNAPQLAPVNNLTNNSFFKAQQKDAKDKIANRSFTHRIKSSAGM